ncbi:MAG: hypothetical protein DRR42_25730 [Gammaproteobacteria bacterium]|nr:MAG: hypothetical protein DRR42_25730 [Gammaproteobacteria bacterium]
MFVQVGDLFTLQSQGSIAFSIPGRTGNFSAIAEFVENQDSTNYSWAGSLDSAYPGYLVYIKDTIGVIGFIQLEDSHYFILPVDAQHSWLMETDIEFNLHCGNDTIKQVPPETCPPLTSACPAVIDVLLLAAPSAQNYFANFGRVINGTWVSALPLYVRLAELMMNWPVWRSGVGNKLYRYRYLDYDIQDFETNFKAFGNNISNDILSLIDNLDAQSIRDAARADLVTLLTDESEYGSIYGIAGTLETDDRRSFSIVQLKYTFGRNTTGHELTHLHGGRHSRKDQGGNDDSPVCHHGWRFVDDDNNTQYTVMANIDLGEQRILNFSNPDIEFNGAPTGT